METEKPSRTKRILIIVLTVLLWVATSVMAIVDISFLTDIAVGIYFRIQNDLHPSQALYMATSFGRIVTALIGVAVGVFVVVSGELHAKHLGRRKSWVLFAGTIAVELCTVARRAVRHIERAPLGVVALLVDGGGFGGLRRALFGLGRC